MYLLMPKGTGLKKPDLWATAGNTYQNQIDTSTLSESRFLNGWVLPGQIVQKNVTRKGTLKSSTQPWKTDTTA